MIDPAKTLSSSVIRDHREEMMSRIFSSFMLVFMFLFCACASGTSDHTPVGVERTAPAAEEQESMAIEAPATAATPIDGRWRLRQLRETPIPAMAARLVYVLEEGKGSYIKNGRTEGDGFTYTVEAERVMLNGAGEEALLDTGEQPVGFHHYNFTITGNTMEWSVPDPFSAAETKTIYVFERY